MNTETALPGVGAPHTAAPGATRRTLRTLIRREFWEHTALWLVPLIVTAALAVVTIFAKTIAVRVNDVSIQQIDAPARIFVLNMSQLLWVAVLYVAAAIVGAFVALDCLYAERKDRSILFWKSLPVSDGLTVLSKFLVIVAVAPLGIFLLAAVGSPAGAGHLATARRERCSARCRHLEHPRVAARRMRHSAVPDPRLALVRAAGRRLDAAVGLGQAQSAAVGDSAAGTGCDIRAHRVPHQASAGTSSSTAAAASGTSSRTATVTR